MSTSEDSDTKHQYAPNLETDGTDVPPTGSDEDMLDRIASATRSTASENTIKSHTLASLSLGLIPIPLFDFAMLTANQIAMVRTLGGVHGGQTFKESRLKVLVVSLVAGALPVLGVMSLSSGLKLMPGVGSLLGSGSIAVSGAILTYAVGRVFVKHFESGGTYLNFDMKKARAQLNAEIQKGRDVVANLKKRAESAAQPDAA